MLPTAHQVFASVEPCAVIADLQLPVAERDGAFFTPHPQYPEHELQILGSQFIGSGYQNPTPGCNVFDFLALHFGSYEQGLDFLIARYFHLARTLPGLALDSLRQSFIESLTFERKRFEDILALREPFRNHSEKLTVAYMYCRRLDLEAGHAWRMFWVASGHDLNQLLTYATKVVAAFDPTEHYFIFPYLENHHRFALLQIEDAQGNPVRDLELVPSGCMFFGLHSCLPDQSETRVFCTRQEALQAHSWAMLNGDSRVGYLHVRFGPATELSTPPLAQAVFVPGPTSDFNTLARTQKAFERLDIAAGQDRVIPWRD